MSHPHRFFIDSIPEELIKDGKSCELALSQEDSRHALRVLRLEEGSALHLISRQTGHQFRAILTGTSSPALVKVIGLENRSAPANPVGTLAFALSKGAKNDFVCEKASELGVPQIIFWMADRSVVKIHSPADGQKKLERWQRIAEAAAKQSGNNLIPKITLALSLEQLIEELEQRIKPSEQLLVCALEQDAKPVRELVLSGASHVVVGPEGDFTENELQLLMKRRFASISLGPATLRSETAAVVAIAAIQAVCGFDAR